MEKKLAEETSLLAMKISSTLNRHLQKIMDQASKEDFEKMRKGVGFVMGYLYTDIMEPLWREHPDLRPVKMNGTYQVPEDVTNGFKNS